MRRPGRLSFLLFLSPRRRLEDALKTLIRIEEALSRCSVSTGDIISTTERLQQELEIITQRREIVSCFLRDYQLTNEEVPLS
jgi:hypothetical protein